MMKTLALPLLTLVGLSAGISASDLYVSATRPGAYPTLQAALDAASPGDRILIEDSPAFSFTGATISKSVTIESAGLGRAYVPSCRGSSYHVTALTPGLPLILRRLEFSTGGCMDPEDAYLQGRVVGDILIEDCLVRYPAANPELYAPLVGVSLECTMLWLRNTEITMDDLRWNWACVDHFPTWGSDALRFTGERLVIDNCTLRGGSAVFLAYPPQCVPNLMYTTGDGGSGLRATTASTVITNTTISDGNGGDFGNGNWSRPPQPGRCRDSVFTSPNGVFRVYGSTWISGRNGRIANAPDFSRSAPAPVGERAMVTLSGTGQLGSVLSVNVFLSGEVGIVAFGTQWITGTMVGFNQDVLWVDPFSVFDFVPFAASGSLNLQVPQDPSIVGFQLVLQSFKGLLGFHNPAGIVVRL